jgi:hypothetical protein
MRKLALALLASALMVGTADALAYTKVLLDAVKKTYAPKKVSIESLCHERIGKSTYTRVDLTLAASGKARSAAYQWVGGWRPIWKDGGIVSAVPKRERAHFRWIMRELNRFCGS